MSKLLLSTLQIIRRAVGLQLTCSRFYHIIVINMANTN